MQTGLDAAVNIHQHPGEQAVVRKAHVLARLACAAEQAEEILDRARDARQRVRLHLADVDDGLGLGDLPGKPEFLFRHALREVDAHLLRHRRVARAEDRLVRPEAKALQRVGAGVVAGRIAEADGAAAVLLQQPEYRPQHLRVRGNGAVGLRGL